MIETLIGLNRLKDLTSGLKAGKFPIIFSRASLTQNLTCKLNATGLPLSISCAGSL